MLFRRPFFPRERLTVVWRYTLGMAACLYGHTTTFVCEHFHPHPRTRAANPLTAPAKPSQVITKTSLMLGVGETPTDVEATLRDLRAVGCDVVTFGQYLRPSKRHMPMKEYVTPEAFAEWQRVAEVRMDLHGLVARQFYEGGGGRGSRPRLS